MDWRRIGVGMLALLALGHAVMFVAEPGAPAVELAFRGGLALAFGGAAIACAVALRRRRTG